MRPLRYLPSYTASEYRLWEGEWELIDGLPYAMSPSPVKRHQWLATILSSDLTIGLRGAHDACGKCIAVQDVDWIVDDRTVLRPDIAVICDKSGDFITTPPVLIIEILSPATALKDRQVKYDIYMEQGVKYYIIADPKLLTYNVYVLSDGQYSERDTTLFNIHDGCTISLDLSKALAALDS